MLSDKIWQHPQLLVLELIKWMNVNLQRRLVHTVGPRGEAPLDSSLASTEQEGQGRGGRQEESPEGCGQTSSMCCTSMLPPKAQKFQKAIVGMSLDDLKKKCHSCTSGHSCSLPSCQGLTVQQQCLPSLWSDCSCASLHGKEGDEAGAAPGKGAGCEGGAGMVGVGPARLSQSFLGVRRRPKPSSRRTRKRPPPAESSAAETAPSCESAKLKLPLLRVRGKPAVPKGKADKVPPVAA